MTVRFAILPVHSWHNLDNVTKRRVGIVGQQGQQLQGRPQGYGNQMRNQSGRWVRQGRRIVIYGA